MSDITQNLYGDYTSKSIGVSDMVEKHRRNPAQYLRASNVDGIWNQFTEILDNARDETIQYHNKTQEVVNTICRERGIEPFKVPPLVITVNINEDDTVEISDMGRGMPCDIHEETGEPAVFSIFENDSAGAKGTFVGSSYGSEGTSGMHGAGASVSKSCTEFFDVTINEGMSGHQYFLQYRKGYRNTEIGDNGLYCIGEIGLHSYPQLAELGIKSTGTYIRYKYDSEVLEATRAGTPTEPYNKEAMIKRIEMSMLGIQNKDALVINFNFHGELTVITPYSMTPEKYLGIDTDSPHLVKLEVGRKGGASDDKSRFSGTLYLKFNPANFGFKCKTIVNKLEQTFTQHDKILDNALNLALRDILKAWVDQNSKKELIMEHGNSFRPSDKFEGLFVMDLPIAEFGGQTKDRLESTAYIGSLRAQVTNKIKANPDLVTAPIQFFQQEIEENTKRVKQREKEKEKAAKKMELSAREMEETAYIESLSGDIISKLMEESKGAFSLDIKRPVNLQKEKCIVCFFEGDSANMVVNSAIENGEQIVSVVTKGKLPNIHKNRDKIVTDKRIRQMRTRIFNEPYAYYYIIVDPDADGTHIRTQLLRIIQEFRPDMLEQGRVIVCRAPHGQVHITGDPIKVNTIVEGERVLHPGTNFVLSREEMDQAVAQGAVRGEVYRGALDVITKCQSILPFEKMIKDPLYLVRIVSPTQRHLDLLDDVLATKSTTRGSVTRKMYTKRQMYSRYIAKQATKNKLGIKVEDMSRPTVCQVTSVPQVKDFHEFVIPYH